MSAVPRTSKMGKKRGLSGAKIAFVEWLLAVRPSPATQQDLAKELGVACETLSRWRYDPLVVRLIEKSEERRVAAWAQATMRLQRIALYGKDQDAIAAIRELGRIWGRYPSEKLSVSVDRVAYVEPGALRDLAVRSFPELEPAQLDPTHVSLN